MGGKGAGEAGGGGQGKLGGSVVYQRGPGGGLGAGESGGGAERLVANPSHVFYTTYYLCQLQMLSIWHLADTTGRPPITARVNASVSLPVVHGMGSGLSLCL